MVEEDALVTELLGIAIAALPGAAGRHGRARHQVLLIREALRALGGEPGRRGKKPLETATRSGQDSAPAPRAIAASVWGSVCMIGLVLVTHGALAVEFKSALEHVVGPQDLSRPSPSAPMTTWRSGATTSSTASMRPITGDGVVILTDMFGGTPSNLAISVMQNREVEVIAGVNLPMLVKLARVRGDIDDQGRGQDRRRRPAANTSTSPATCWTAESQHGHDGRQPAGRSRSN